MMKSQGSFLVWIVLFACHSNWSNKNSRISDSEILSLGRVCSTLTVSSLLSLIKSTSFVTADNAKRHTPATVQRACLSLHAGAQLQWKS